MERLRTQKIKDNGPKKQACRSKAEKKFLSYQKKLFVPKFCCSRSRSRIKTKTEKTLNPRMSLTSSKII